MQSTCYVDKCANEVRAKALCKSHYRRLLKYGSPNNPCNRCGEEIPTGSHPRTKYCEVCKAKCSIDGCFRPIRRNGMCQAHSHRMTVSGSVERPCKTCGKEIPFDSGVSLRYCSEQCNPVCAIDDCNYSLLARGFCKEHYRRWERNGSPFRPCLTCGKELEIGSTRGRKYCSKACFPQCSADGCGDRAEGDIYCPRHILIFKKYGSIPSRDYACASCGSLVERSHSERFIKNTRKLCPDCKVKQYRDHGDYRKSVINSGHAICGLCDEEIDLELKWPDPMSLTIDHIIPLALGGTNEDINLQPTHQKCNFKKGARLAIPKEGEVTLF